MLRSLAVLTVVATLGAAACSARAAVPVWTDAAPLGTARYSANGVPLPGGNALIIGGRSDYGEPMISVERFDGAKWAEIAPLKVARDSASAITLRDGRVLVAGGESSPLHYLASTELFDPASGTWTLGPSFGAPRSAFALQLLSDGRVLAVGGWDAGNAAEVLDGGAWKPAGDVVAMRADPAAARLADGRVLVAGGWNATDHVLASAEVYDPAKNTWTALPAMHVSREGAAATTLPDGRVMVAGGAYFPTEPPVNSVPPRRQTYELYDPATNTWSAPQPFPRTDIDEIITLTDGRLLLFPHEYSPDQTATLFSPATGTWARTTTMNRHRAGHVAIALTDGTILTAGGFAAGKSTQRLTFPPDPPVTSVGEFVQPTPVGTATPVFGDTPPPVPRAVASLALPARLHGSSLTVTVRCTGDRACTGKLTLRAGSRTLATKTLTVAAGKSKAVKLTLSKANRKRLAHRRTKVTLAFAGAKVTKTLRG
jgi:hypothetical protein